MPRRVLVADEADAVRSVTINLFRQRGYEVLTASAGQEAWEIVKSGKIDLALIDAALVGMDGYTISKLIKDDPALKDTSVILILSQSEIVNQHQLITARPDGNLTKPFTPADLLAKAGDILGEDLAPTKSAGDEPASDSGTEMIVGEEHSAQEIDFESIFDDDDKGGNVEDIHLNDVLDENSKSESGEDSQVSEIDFDSDREGMEMSPEKKQVPVEDDSIRIAQDQYGLEEPFEPPEVEVPHDYNWFIREMKNEISGKSGETTKTREKPKAQPKESKTDKTPTGHFTVEEIGSSKVEVPENKGAGVEKGLGETLADEGDSAIGLDDLDGEAKLALAEKLLIKELASKMAEKLMQKISRRDLLLVLEEVLSELKKY